MRRDGIALVVTLGLLLLIFLLAMAGAFRTQIELWITRNDTTSVQAFYAAESGLQKYKAVLFQNYVWEEARRTTGGAAGCYSSLVTGIDLQRNGIRLTFTGDTLTLADGEEVHDADGNPIGRYWVQLVRDSRDGQLFTLVSRGTSGGAKATVQATFRLSNTGYLEQAIFAGQGQANRWLNGGATIRGGLYIVGNPQDPDQEVISANGNFSLLNAYDLRGHSVLAPRMEEAYRKVDDLCASLRVQYGKISVGGSTQIGQPSNKVKGVFVGRGREDIGGNAADVCQNNRGVCAEAVGPFDLSNPPPFPNLDDSMDSEACQGYPSWRACLQERSSLRIRREGNSLTVLRPSIFPLDATCTSAMSSGTLVLDGFPVNCLFPGGGFIYIPVGTNGGLLQIYGDVVLEGINVVFRRNIDYQILTDSRAATFTALAVGGVGGNMDVNGNLLPLASHGLYPRHVLGLVAEGQVYQRGNYLMAPVYAGVRFRIVRNNMLLGSVITNEFCTTSAGNSTGCNAGQKAEVVYVRIPKEHRPILLPDLKEGNPVFQVLSYERR